MASQPQQEKETTPPSQWFDVEVTEAQVRDLPAIVRRLASMGIVPTYLYVYREQRSFWFEADPWGGDGPKAPTADEVIGAEPGRPQYYLRLKHVGHSGIAAIWEKWGVTNG